MSPSDAPFVDSIYHPSDFSEAPASADYTFRREDRSGDVVDTIVGLADEIEPNLIVMATHGHDDFLDVLRGSVTEQVLRRAPCPLLAVPAD